MQEGLPCRPLQYIRKNKSARRCVAEFAEFAEFPEAKQPESSGEFRESGPAGARVVRKYVVSKRDCNDLIGEQREVYFYEYAKEDARICRRRL